MTKYLWQHPSWPNFTWDEDSISKALTSLTNNSLMLKSQYSVLDSITKANFVLNNLATEIQKSFEIEGIKLSQNGIKSSLIRKLNLEDYIIEEDKTIISNDASMDLIVDTYLDSIINSSSPLTKERLFSYNSSLFGGQKKVLSGSSSIKVGQYRTDSIYVISGSMDNQQVHYEAPPASSIETEMASFISWFNTQDIIPTIKSAITHLYFVSIHPFQDGNGRVTRILSNMDLYKSTSTIIPSLSLLNKTEDINKVPLFSFSEEIYKEHKDYYKKLEEVQSSSLDITSWIIWYIKEMNNAVLSSMENLQHLQAKLNFWNKIHTQNIILSSSQKKILSLLLDDFYGKLTDIKYAKICKCSLEDSKEELKELVDYNLLQKIVDSDNKVSYTLVL